MDPHEIVGVAQDATEAEIRTAYKKLAMQWHPDRPSNASRRAEATEKFAEINRAHRILLRRLRKAQREQTEKVDPDVRSKDRQPRPRRPSASKPAPPAEPSPAESSPSPPSPPSAPSPPAASTSPKASQDVPLEEPLASSHSSTPSSSDTEQSGSSASSYASARSSRTSLSDQGPFTFQSSSLPEFPDWESISCSPSTSPSVTSLPRSTSSTSDASSSAPASTTGDARRSRLRKSSPSKKDEIDSSTAADKVDSDSSPSSQNITNDTQSSPYCPERVDGTLRPDRPILRGRASDVSRTWTHVLPMALEELYHGKTFHFNIVRYRLSGKKSIYPLELEVPSGCRDGSEIIIPGVGNERKDGSRQDIIFLIKESTTNESKFRRVHDNLVMDVRLGWVDSLDREEGVVHFTGVDGQELAFTVDYHVSRVLSGTVVIPNAGMMLRNGNGQRGKLLVRWSISSPKASWGESLKKAVRVKTKAEKA